MEKIIEGGWRTGHYNANSQTDIESVLQIWKDFEMGTKEGQIIFVVKTNVDVIISPRRKHDYLPHPNLSGGEPVYAAGTITPDFNPDGSVRRLLIVNNSGHFKPSIERVRDSGIDNILKSYGYSVRVDEGKFFNP